MSARFAGQVALLSGEGDGLCLALARALGEEGAQVALAGSDGQGGSAAEAAGARYYALNLGDGQAVAAVVGSIVDQYGRIDLWVHTVAAASAAGAEGTLHCARVIGPLMARQGGGRVVFVASVAGLFAGAGQAQRGMREAGLFMLARSLAVDWAAQGVRVNAIARGVVQQDGAAPDERLRERIPMGRAARQEEVLEAVLFLADERESSFVTGEVLRVDGGWTAYHLFHPFSQAF